MYGRDVGPFNAATGGNVYRVAMDGSGEMKLTLSGGTHHDLTVTPTGIAYPAKQAAGGCDCIYVAGADGSDRRRSSISTSCSASSPSARAPRRRRSATSTPSATTRIPTASPSPIARRTPSLSSPARARCSARSARRRRERPPTTPRRRERTRRPRRCGASSTATTSTRPNKIVLWSNGVVPGRHVAKSSTTRSTDRRRSSTGNTRAPATRPRSATRSTCPTATSSSTNSQSGAVHEIDPSQKLVQSFSSLSKGYSSHRPTLYGPPPGR